MRSKHDFPTLNAKLPDGVRPTGKPYRIMVVEDKEAQRRQICQILESEGYDIVGEAENGIEAMAIYDKLKGNIDVITTDLDMPQMDGYAMMFELKSRESNCKIVFVSEETTKGVLQDLLQMGISGYILKPVNRGRILERMKKIVSSIS